MNNPLVILATTATVSIKSAEENLGLAYLAAVCRKEHIEVIIIDGWLEKLTTEEIIHKILAERTPLFVGLSCNLLGDKAIEIVKTLKKEKYPAPFLAGGFGPTFNPEKYLESGFDFVGISESESMIASLCHYFISGYPSLTEIKGLCYFDERHNLHYSNPDYIVDLNELPFPSRDTMSYVVSEKTPVNILTSRGCMANCLFCSIAAYWKLGKAPKWRGRSIQNIVDEIEQLYNNGVRHFKFVDDSFIEPPREEAWCNAFADEINKRMLHIRFRITMRADRVSEGIITALQRAGCDSVACGIENFSDTALQRMGKKANVTQNKRALDIFNKCNIYVQMGFILFDDNTTFNELIENYELMNHYAWTICKGVFSEMFAARGTRYTEKLQRRGELIPDHLQSYYVIKDDKVRIVYKALKAWYINQMKIYNMVIEPLNKPKALSDEGLASFYNLYLDIRKKDLNFMGDILNSVKNNKDQQKLNEFINYAIQNCNEYYKKYETIIDNLYMQEGITYMADEDPFTR